MRRRIHGVLFGLLTVGLGLAATSFVGGRRSHAFGAVSASERQPRSSRFITDASGHAWQSAEYRRIASCSSIADAVLPDLVASERLVTVTRWYAEGNPDAARVRELRRISGPEELETILSLRPDLVIVSNFSGDDSPLERLRERGLVVFDLGPMLGRKTLEKNLRDLATLLGQHERGERMARDFHRRMSQVAAHVPASQRKRAMYLNLYDTQLTGGTVGSSYHDVLTAAGLIDAAAHRQGSGAGWPAFPRYRIEDVLSLDPDVIVTVRGKGRHICDLAGLRASRPCRDPEAIVEVDEGRLNDPGPGMLSAAEEICDRLYPTPK